MNDRVFGFCLGLGVGVGIGILFAPKSGQSTRSLISESAIDGAASMKRRGAEILQKGSDIVKQDTGASIQTLKAALDAGNKAYSDAISEPSA
jgi:gas vesicle protein